MMKRIEIVSKLEKVPSALYWNYRLPVSASDANKIIDKDKRINCTIEDRLTFNCALLPDGKGEFYININKNIRTTLKLEIGQIVKLIIEKDESEYGIPIPLAFKELLYQDPEGKVLFNALTPGKRRSLLYVIAKPKSEQKQLEKGLVVLNYLKENNGVLNFRELNEAFKTNRF